MAPVGEPFCAVLKLINASKDTAADVPNSDVLIQFLVVIVESLALKNLVSLQNFYPFTRLGGTNRVITVQ